MARALARTRKRYTPLDLAYSSSVSGALNQNYDASYQTYDPDRGLIPLEILFTVRATDPKKVIDPGIINGKLTDVRWYENVVDEAHNITDGNTAYVIDRNGNSDSRGKITVKKNTPLEGVVLIFTAKYTDPRDGKVVNVNATISLGVTVSTDEPLRVKVDYPYGQVVDPTENRDFVEIDNILYRGDEEYEGSIYRWLKKEGGDYTAIEEGDNGITGAYTGKLKVPCHVVGKRLDLRCVTDVLPDLAGVNLVSKAMISDDWNALKSGISTPGEDADGKYLAIKQMELYNAFNNGKDDIFGEKIKYKPNQRYRLSVKWKMQGEQEHGGIVFVIKYTDGSSEQRGIAGGKVSLETVRLITKPGKTVQKITSLYGTNLHDTNLYDLQLVEYHGENLVTGGSKKKRIKNNDAIFSGVLTAKKYSLRVMDWEITGGKTSEYFICTILSGLSLVSGITMFKPGKVGVITVNDDFDLSNGARFILYAGSAANASMEALFHDLMLVEGEYTDETMPAYTPAADEFVPAIADGGERWQELSGKEITTDHVLSTQYPRCNTEIVAPSMILDETSLFEARVVMHSSRGDIENPQLYWGFPWKDKTGAIFARGSKIFIKEEQFDNGEFDYSVDPVEGLAEAKWAANFNGIDQYLSNNNSTAIYPWGYGGARTHVVEFIIDEINEVNQATVITVSYAKTDNSLIRGFAIALNPDGKIQYRVGGAKDEFSLSLTRYGSTVLVPGKLYRVEVIIIMDGSFIAKVNGVEDKQVTGGAANYSSSYIFIGSNTSNFFNGKVLRYEIFNEDKSVYHLWDFQPTNGDRANMLKNKNEDGSVKGTLNLTPVNVPGIDNVDPENGFFVTI